MRERGKKIDREGGGEFKRDRVCMLKRGRERESDRKREGGREKSEIK